MVTKPKLVTIKVTPLTRVWLKTLAARNSMTMYQLAHLDYQVKFEAANKADKAEARLIKENKQR